MSEQAADKAAPEAKRARKRASGWDTPAINEPVEAPAAASASQPQVAPIAATGLQQQVLQQAQMMAALQRTQVFLCLDGNANIMSTSCTRVCHFFVLFDVDDSGCSRCACLFRFILGFVFVFCFLGWGCEIFFRFLFSVFFFCCFFVCVSVCCVLRARTALL